MHLLYYLALLGIAQPPITLGADRPEAKPPSVSVAEQPHALIDLDEPIPLFLRHKTIAIGSDRVRQYKPLYKALVIWALQLPQYQALALLGDDARCFPGPERLSVKVRGVPVLLAYPIGGPAHGGCSLDVCTVPRLSEKTRKVLLGS